MSLPRTVAEVLTDHVTLEVEGIDRMYLNVYQPRLQTDRGVAAFFRFHRGETFASSALMAPMSTAFIDAVDRFVRSAAVTFSCRFGTAFCAACAVGLGAGLWLDVGRCAIVRTL